MMFATMSAGLQRMFPAKLLAMSGLIAHLRQIKIRLGSPGALAEITYFGPL
jgi:hypothetical protein